MGMGQKMKPPENRRESSFHLPGFHFGYIFLTHSHIRRIQLPTLFGLGVGKWRGFPFTLYKSQGFKSKAPTKAYLNGSPNKTCVLVLLSALL